MIKLPPGDVVYKLIEARSEQLCREADEEAEKEAARDVHGRMQGIEPLFQSTYKRRVRVNEDGT